MAGILTAETSLKNNKNGGQKNKNKTRVQQGQMVTIEKSSHNNVICAQHSRECYILIPQQVSRLWS